MPHIEMDDTPSCRPAQALTPLYATTDRVHLREGAGTQFRSITILERDRVLPAVEPTSGEWIQLRHYDRTGYVHRSLLKPAPPPDDEQQQS
ncbi:SH3 domain-containing protein [Algiphilus sp.]|uniref:SH3 domain-containing protein n=1 Tax=Algiphilus sp. TaxID=1872431 RepID=UPI0032EBD643